VNSGCGTDILCSPVTVTSCAQVIAAFNYSDTALSVYFNNLSVNAGSWSWDFGDGNTSSLQNPSHTYTSPDTYPVCLTSTSACSSDSICISVTIQTVGIEQSETEKIKLFPNPTDGLLTVELPSEATRELTFIVYNMLGEVVYNARKRDIEHSSASGNQISYNIDLQYLSDGAYLMQIIMGDKMHMEEIVISR